MKRIVCTLLALVILAAGGLGCGAGKGFEEAKNKTTGHSKPKVMTPGKSQSPDND